MARAFQLSRREWMGTAVCAASSLGMPVSADEQRAGPSEAREKRVPVVDITDLYHPPQDPGDNFDLIAAYGLPGVDLRAVILDVSQRYRRPHTVPGDAYSDPSGPRDPGFIPVVQLNYLFGRNVPCAPGPFEPMRAPEDPMRDAPPFQQAGIRLLLDTLRESRAPVEVMSFGSARPLAVACNREPTLLREKVRRVHLCAGAAPPGYLEWNVQLDRHAFVRVLRSDLPVTIYPCATDKGPFDLGPHNCYWKLPDLQFIRRMDKRLQRYCAFAFERSARVDFLNALEDDVPEEVLERVCARPHSVWETAVWMAVSNRRLVRRADGTCRILPAYEVAASDAILPNEARPGKVAVKDDGQFQFEISEVSPSNVALYDRGDPVVNEAALREALPALYASFAV